MRAHNNTRTEIFYHNAQNISIYFTYNLNFTEKNNVFNKIIVTKMYNLYIFVISSRRSR